MKPKYIAITLLSLSLLLVSSCKKDNKISAKKAVKKSEIILKELKPNQVKKTDKNTKVEFSEFPRSTAKNEKLKLRYKFNVGETRNIVHFLKMSMMYDSILSEIDTQIYGSYKVIKKLSSHNYSLTWNISRIVINVKADKQILKYDSDSKENTLEQGKVFKNLINVNINSNVNDLGEFSVLDLKTLFSSIGENLSDNLKEQLKKKANEFVNISFITLPKDELKTGELYLGKENVQESSNLEIYSLKKYLFKGILNTNDNIIVLIPKIEVKPVSNKQKIELKSNKVDGWLLFDKEKGQLTESYTHTKLNMSINKIKVKMDLRSNFKVLF